MKKYSYEQLSTSELQKLLRDDCDGKCTLSVEDTLAICEILVRRDGKASQSARKAWAKFRKCYMNDLPD